MLGNVRACERALAERNEAERCATCRAGNKCKTDTRTCAPVVVYLALLHKRVSALLDFDAAVRVARYLTAADGP